MLRTVRGLLAFGVLLASLHVLSARAADDKDEMVANPKYTMWAGHKAGATAVHVEKTAHSGEEKESFPGGVDEKVITYTLLSVSADKVVVRAVVVEKEFLGTIEAAPTKMTYPAKVNKAYLAAALHEFGVKAADAEEAVKVGGKEIKCKVLSGTHKEGETTIDFKLCYSDTVPGGIVARKRTAKLGGKLVAETTVTLRSYKEAPPPKAPKEPK
jgi:hypothetical protein